MLRWTCPGLLALTPLLVAPAVPQGPLGERRAASSQRAPGALLFRSDRGGAANGLYRVSLGGGAVEQVVAGERDVMHFAVDPRGERVAYVSDPGDIEAFELHVMDLGTRAESVVGRGIRLAPAWSRDGTRLAYMAYSDRWRIRLTNPEVRIERPPQAHIGGDGAPAWFPDGRSLVLQSNRSGNLELCRADARTGRVTAITATDEAESSPEVSPDGRWIAYQRAGDVWVMRADGTGARNLSRSEGRDHAFAWAPDSARLALVSDRSGNADVFIVELGSGTARAHSPHPAEEGAPAWSPDGRRLAFTSTRDGDEEIYVADLSGERLVRVTHDPGRDRSPAWLPAP